MSRWRRSSRGGATSSRIRRRVRTTTGTGFVLRGSKLLVHDAPGRAAIHRLCGHSREVSALFAVDASLPGVTHRAYPLIDGRLAADVDFVDVELPAQHCFAVQPRSETSSTRRSTGCACSKWPTRSVRWKRVMEQTADHLRNRKQFGQPLAAFQALQHRMAEMFVEVQETRSALYHALAHLEATPVKRNAAVSSAKVVAIEAGRIVGGQGIQLHGGVGMTDEYQVGHFFKRLLVLENSWGDVDFHLDRIARAYG